MHQTRRPLIIAEALTLLIAAGTLFGGLRVVALAIANLWLGRYVQQGVNLVWAAPLGLALLALTGGVVLWISGTFVPALRRPSVFMFAAVWITATSFAMNISGLYTAAAAVLGAGVASVAVRLLQRHPHVTMKAARVVAIAGVLSIALAFTTLVAAAPAVESWRTSKIAPPPSGAPNVLLIVLDTVRAKSLGAYGNVRNTSPFLDALGKSGIRFTQAFAPAPWTTPTHASIMTGLWPTELSVNWNRTLDGGAPTVAEVLRDAGYLTAGFVANVGKAGRSSGIGRGFTHYEDYPASPWAILRGSRVGDRIASSMAMQWLRHTESLPGRKRSPGISADFLRWLDRQPERPFFAFLNFLDAHHPYESPDEFEARFGVTGNDEIGPTPLKRLGEGDPRVAQDLRRYEAAIAYQDDQLRRLFAELERRGKLSNTLVVVTSDHGEEFGEHGAMRHGRTLYQAAVHVPLIVSFPGRLQGGRQISTPVSLRSVASSLTGVVPGLRPGVFRGPSLFDVIADPAAAEPVLSSVDGVPDQPAWFPVHYGPLYGILHRGHRYIVNAECADELYLLSDLDEKTNLASDPREQPLLNELRRELNRALNRPASVATR
jgi:arylsulfatase A-like enzyme